MGVTPTWVVKIGGSLWSSGELRSWLAALADLHGTRVVIVPGGGPFAESVRVAQPRIGFGDSAAHRMAILGMEQHGIALLDLEPRLAGASTLADLRGAPGAVVWLPSALAAGAPVPETWAVTSDSLAAWVAGALGAERLVLVKSAALPEGQADVRDLSAAGIVDEALPALMERAGFDLRCVGSGEHRAFADACRAGAGFGTRVTTCLGASCS